MSQVTQPSLLRAVVGFALRFFKCRALRGCPRSILTEEAVSPQGGGNGDLPPREQPGQTMQLWAHYLIDTENSIWPRLGALRREAWGLSLLLPQTQDAESIFHYSCPFYHILYCQSDLVLQQFFSKSTHQGENQPDKYQTLPSLFLTCYCSKSAQNDAQQQECFERLEIPRTLTRQWKYCGL